MSGPGRPTRVFVPLTPAGLGELARLREVAGPAEAFAATPRLRGLLALPAGSPDVDDELAEAALVAAADASVVLLGRHGCSPCRRVVLAADVEVPDGSRADAHAHPASVGTLSGIALSQVVSVHVDGPDAEPAVAAAARAAMSAGEDLGDVSVEDALDILDEHALEWFDALEIPDVVSRLSDAPPRAESSTTM